MTSRILLRGFAAVVIVSAAITYALTGTGPAQSAQQTPTAAEESAIAHVAAFQRAASARDDVPGQTMLAGIVRRVGGVSTAKPVWASMEPEQDCVQLGENGASACGAVERLQEEPLMVGGYGGQGGGHKAGSGSPTPQEWAGLAEDAVESIGVVYEDGEEEEIPVVENGFYVPANGRSVKSFSWTIEGTVHSYPGG